jgi:hypothetical protein
MKKVFEHEEKNNLIAAHRPCETGIFLKLVFLIYLHLILHK